MTIDNVKQRIFDNLTSEEIKTYNFANKVNLMEGMLISIQPIAIGLFLYHAYNNTVTNLDYIYCISNYYDYIFS